MKKKETILFRIAIKITKNMKTWKCVTKWVGKFKEYYICVILKYYFNVEKFMQLCIIESAVLITILDSLSVLFWIEHIDKQLMQNLS